ncbi:glycoside hydrolase family 97 protein [Maribellus sediminis]|uniref:glycoside hydrolase family 97 protein n=1 Tax=Maribellus sediminis TaxID=2696285 RepID=UPI0014310F74|nr:glycoside hydrolase family 97 protein [Maribellus sediminis]
MKLFLYQRLIVVAFIPFVLLVSCSDARKIPGVTSKDGLNEIVLSLNKQGELFYDVKHDNEIVIEHSPLGLICDDEDFSRGLTITEITPVAGQREKYELIVGHQKNVDHVFNRRSVILKNGTGAFLTIDLIAGDEGVAFRYRFSEERKEMRVVEKELTGFRIEKSAKAWLQPYNSAGNYTPAYEDFYFNVSIGDTIENPRNKSVGWCMPALFNVNNKSNWLLIAESGTDGSFCGCHLNPNSEDGIYKVEFANDNEVVTLKAEIKNNAKPRYTLPWTMPWRTIIIGDDAGEILLSTMITDLAPASKIEDTSWISSGKASWAWWSHDCDGLASTYNKFTDLAADFNWEYTLFDAKWEASNRDSATLDYANARGIKPFVWGYSGDYYKPENRRNTLKTFKEMGVAGVKIDFWCSDRQEAIKTIHALFKDAAEQKLLVNIHGCTVPRGWHRTWPNFVTAEAVLGTESYLYEPRFPATAAEQNTVLPFTRNVAGPTDYTPVALTIRKFPRLNTAVHELATALVYTSGVIHFADSKKSFESLPDEIKTLLKEIPATWDHTESLMAEPGKVIVLARQKNARSYVVGINGTDKELPVKLNFEKYSSFSNCTLISEGDDPLMDFSVKTIPVTSRWSYTFAPRGAFIIRFNK